MQQIFSIGLIQMACSPTPQENVDRAIRYIHQAVQQGANLVCLPELFSTQYFCQREDADLFDLAEPVPGPLTDHLGRLAKQTGIVLIAPLFERRAKGLYHNSVVVIDQQGRLTGLYRKMHIPDDPGYYEKFYFTPGDAGFQVVPTEFGTIGLLICWDQWYPEAARLTALKGADILIYPTAIGWHPHEKAQEGKKQQEAWATIQRSHAIANGIFVAAINRVGWEQPLTESPGIEFWGHSFVCDPFGGILAQASSDKEEVLVTKIDTAQIEDTRRHWPFLRDRRIDAYDGLVKRFLDKTI